MFSQYTWGQFFLFVLALLVIYYLVVGFLYYRNELAAMLKGQKSARSPALAAAGTPPALVRTTSAFAAAPASEAAAPVVDAAGAAENLPEPTAALVTGTLPDSAAAKGSDTGTAEEAAPMDAEVASAAEQEQQLDESRPDEQLDEADKALAEMIRQAGVAAPVAEAASVSVKQQAGSAVAEADEDPSQPIFIENNNNIGGDIETETANFSVEADIVYQPAVADDSDLFAAFDERLASPLDILPVVQEPLFEADSLAAFLAQVQLGNKPVVPAELRGTSLVEQMADLTMQNNLELLELLGQEA